MLIKWGKVNYKNVPKGKILKIKKTRIVALESSGMVHITYNKNFESISLKAWKLLGGQNFTRTHARAHARTYAHTHAHTHACTHTRTHARTHARTHTRTRAHARTHTYTHTHTHTHTLSRTHIYCIYINHWGLFYVFFCKKAQTILKIRS